MLAEPPPRARSAALVTGVVMSFVALLQVHPLDDGDTWWHLASGRRIAETHAIAHADPFSFTARGAPWLNRQWLFDLGAYGAWRAGGAPGLALAAGALFVLAFAALFAVARRRMPAWAAAALVYLAANAAVERFTVRPEALTFAFVAVYLLALDTLPMRAPTAALFIGAHILWANSHALSVLGIALLASELAGRAARWLAVPAGWRDGRPLGALTVATVGAVLAEAATPFAIAGAVFPLRLLGVLRGAELTSQTIVEHRATALAEISPAAAAGLVGLFALAAVAAVVSWRRWRLSHLLVALGFGWLAVLARRNVGLAGFGLVPLIADGLGPAAGALERRRPRLAAALGVMIALGLAVDGARIVTGRYYDTARVTRFFGLGVSQLLVPEAAVAYLDRLPPDARIFNDDGLGGYIIWRTRRPVFIDGRLQVYPPNVYREYQAVLDDPRAFASVAGRHGITAAIFYHPAPGRLEVAASIARLPGWHLAYLDGAAVVLVAGGADEPVAGLRDPVASEGSGATERALLHYQRGRAALYLLGRSGIDAARSDFTAALQLWPSLDEARAGLRAVGAAPR